MNPWGACLEYENVATIQCIVPLMENVLTALAGLAVVALFLMVVIGGYRFLFAGGDPKKIQQAKGSLTAAIIGIIVMAVAVLIINLVSAFTGVNVSEFRIPGSN